MHLCQHERTSAKNQIQNCTLLNMNSAAITSLRCKCALFVWCVVLRIWAINNVCLYSVECVFLNRLIDSMSNKNVCAIVPFCTLTHCHCFHYCFFSLVQLAGNKITHNLFVFQSQHKLKTDITSGKTKF